MAKIGLDAAHYPGDGRVGSAWEKALGTADEYTLNVRVFDAVLRTLEDHGHTVIDIGQQDRSVTSRAKRAGANGCDVVVSIHHNAGGGRGSTLYRHINGKMGTESKALQEKIYNYVQGVNRGNRSTPINTAELGVINCQNTKCPAVLVECAFMDNQTDVDLINSAAYPSRMGAAIASGIMDYVGGGSSSGTSSSGVTKSYNPCAYARVTNLTADDPLLNVRSGPGVEHGVIRRLAQGNEVDVIEEYKNGWAKINIVGQQGYVNAHYLDIADRGSSAQTATVVNCTALNVRKTPNGAVSATIHKGDVVQITGSGKDSDGDTWTKIQCGNVSGYVWPKYLD